MSISSVSVFPPWPVNVVVDSELIRRRLFCLDIQLQCWIFSQDITEIIAIKAKKLWNYKPLVAECSKVVGRPPLVLEATFTAQVLQNTQNEVRPLFWPDQEACLHAHVDEEPKRAFRSGWKQLWQEIFATVSSP
jgi:hypothetical protein